MKIKEIIVVEGRDDTIAIQQAVQADTIETGGSALNGKTLEKIRLAQERRGVIIFTDPDYPGERIRKLISQAVPGCKHAFLPKEKAVSNQGKYGVEHAQSNDIRQALQAVKTEMAIVEELISFQDLQRYGLIGQATSKLLRALLGDKLGIGYSNAKQFHKRLQAFCISKEELEQAYQAVLEEVKDEERDSYSTKDKGDH